MAGAPLDANVRHGGAALPSAREAEGAPLLAAMANGGSEEAGNADAGNGAGGKAAVHFERTEVEGIAYLPANNLAYRRKLLKEQHRRKWSDWRGSARHIMMVLIGVAVGLVGFALYWCIDTIADWRHDVTKHLLEHGQRSVALAWLYSASISSLLALVASAIVVYYSPEAAGSGVPEVMAFLNGSRLRHVFTVRTFVAKFTSAALAVASGLPVGPEGPMIHLGAMLGAHLSQSISPRLFGSLFARLRNNKDARDFTVAGAAAGVAVAFSAPIGGLLFAFEEVAGYFRVSLAWKVFACCLVAAFMSAISDSVRRAAIEQNEEVFGTIDDEWWQPFGVNGEVEQHVAALVPASVVGVVCGGLAVLFTRLNLRAFNLRRTLIPQSTPLFYRAIEPCAFAFVFATLSLSLPAMIPCTRTGCVYSNPEAEHDPESTLLCSTNSKHARRIVERSMELFTCPADSLSLNTTKDFAAPPSPGGLSSNATQSAYNELATLSTDMAEEAIRHLLTRGTHYEFGFSSLILMLVMYFFGAAWIASSSVACGLFVPMIFIGSLTGRIMGLFLTHFCAALGLGSKGAPPGVFLMTADSAYTWVDPGVFALVGAGAFMGGVTRLTFSLAVIMIEISGETNFLLPILVAILVAKSVATWLCPHALYDSLLTLKAVPFLPENPELSNPEHQHALDAYPVTVACSHQGGKPITVREQVSRLAARRLLATTTHGGFPVVRPTGHGDIFVGFVHRDALASLVEAPDEYSGWADNIEMTDHLWRPQRRDATQIDGAATVVQDAQASPGGSHANGGIHGGLDGLVDLTEHIDTSIVTLGANFSVKRAYQIFQGFALRYLVVIDELNRPVGVVTRKDLIGSRIEQGICERSEAEGSTNVLYEPAQLDIEL